MRLLDNLTIERWNHFSQNFVVFQPILKFRMSTGWFKKSATEGDSGCQIMFKLKGICQIKHKIFLLQLSDYYFFEVLYNNSDCSKENECRMFRSVAFLLNHPVYPALADKKCVRTVNFYIMHSGSMQLHTSIACILLFKKPLRKFEYVCARARTSISFLVCAHAES